MKYILILISLLTLACAKNENNNEVVKSGVENILIIGDESMIAYSEKMVIDLSPNFNKVSVLKNAQTGENETTRNSTYTLNHIEQWINQNPDTTTVILSVGKWDVQNGEPLRNTVSPFDINDYYTNQDVQLQNISKVVEFLNNKGIRVIFLSTIEILENGYFAEEVEMRNNLLKGLFDNEQNNYIDQYELSTLLYVADGEAPNESYYNYLSNRATEQILKLFKQGE